MAKGHRLDRNGRYIRSFPKKKKKREPITIDLVRQFTRTITLKSLKYRRYPLIYRWSEGPSALTEPNREMRVQVAWKYPINN